MALRTGTFCCLLSWPYKPSACTGHWDRMELDPRFRVDSLEQEEALRQEVAQLVVMTLHQVRVTEAECKFSTETSLI